MEQNRTPGVYVYLQELAGHDGFHSEWNYTIDLVEKPGF
jgi:hypothetical protein